MRSWILALVVCLGSGMAWGQVPEKATADTKKRPGVEEQERARRRAARRARRQLRRKQPQAQSRSNEPLVRGGIYDRPYIYRQGSAIAIGGYVEMGAIPRGRGNFG